jgi:hypothetical protein
MGFVLESTWFIAESSSEMLGHTVGRVRVSWPPDVGPKPSVAMPEDNH